MADIRRSFINLWLAVLMVALCGLVVEIIARGFVHHQTGKIVILETPLSRYDSTLGWDKPPGGRQRIERSEYAVDIEINSHGLRGPDRDYKKSEGTRRVLILGDSFAEGYYVNEEFTARSVLERLLNSDQCEKYEVLNAGTAGYSTDQEYLFFQTEGQRYRPDLVILFFFFNDLYYNTAKIGTAKKPKPYFDLVDEHLILRNSLVPLESSTIVGEKSQFTRLRPWQGSMALRLLSNRTADGNPRLHRFLAHFGLVEPISDAPPREFWPYGPGNGREVDDMWHRTAAILKELKQEVEFRGGRLVILYVPCRFEVNDAAWTLTRERYQLGSRWDPERVFARLQATCMKLSIALVDPRNDLWRAESSAVRAYFPKDGHWNEVGNAIAARVLESPIRAFLPCRLRSASASGS